MVSQLLVVLLGVMMSIGAAWLIGNTLAARLEREKKLTERDVNALTTFQELYGDFYSCWKQWGNLPKSSDNSERLLSAAAAVEGKYEALLVLVCSERPLSERDRLALGALRQGIQQLRDSIKVGENLDWWSSEDRSYVALKSLAGYVAVLLRPRAMGLAGTSPQRPTAAEAGAALITVTSNRFEEDWVNSAEALGIQV